MNQICKTIQVNRGDDIVTINEHDFNPDIETVIEGSTDADTETINGVLKADNGKWYNWIDGVPSGDAFDTKKACTESLKG